jgi:lipase chaperone LimK
MIRKQVNLTKEQITALEVLSKTTGKNQNQLIREAVERLIERESAVRLAALGGTQKTIKPIPRRRSRRSLVGQSARATRQAALDAVVGMWKDRTDLPDFAALRRDWDRR